MPALVSTLQVMAASHDVSPLLRYLLPHLVRSVFYSSSEEASLPPVPVFVYKQTSVLKLSVSELCVFMNKVKRENIFIILQLLLDVSAFCVSFEQQQSLGETFLKDAIAERLNDDVQEVVSAALRLLQVSWINPSLFHTCMIPCSLLMFLQMLLDVLDPEDVVSWLLALLHRAHLSTQKWMPVLMEAVRLLSDPRLGKGDAEFVQKTGWKLLPFLVITSAELGIAGSIARSSIFSQHPLTLRWAQELQDVMKKSAEPDFIGLANQRLVSTLTKNLTNMEHFSKRDAVEKLVLLVEQQQSFGLRGRASFLVLTQTLLLSLGALSETQQLLTAQRVYMLLERPLLDAIRRDDSMEVECPVSVPASFSEALVLYLSRCEQQPGERLDREFCSVLIALLREFISSLRCHDTLFKDEAWWNPEKMDTNTCCYLGLICRLFSIIIGGAAEGPMASSCRELMKELIQLDVKVGAVLQTRALYMGRALMEVQPASTLDKLAATDSPEHSGPPLPIVYRRRPAGGPKPCQRKGERSLMPSKLRSCAGSTVTLLVQTPNCRIFR
ncbi:hypothetical protein XENOCAPTIV_022901 [Xenoophorus captivus]|uniref:HEAT repeat-containing protein 1 n=1 Tax=Xenoophorus captivus TaxID=1517983 RepID=A0ABV0S995_9TELE